MEYTVQKLAKLAGVSTRTLRYYDEIDILKPARINSSGYRIYGEEEVDQLQLILFYRELEVSLDQIKSILTDPHFNKEEALKDHHQKLLQKRKELDSLIQQVEKTIQYQKGGIKMSDQEKFEGFKQKLVKENEEKYGEEVRQKYGNDAVNYSSQKVKGMSKEEYDQVTDLGNEIIETLLEAYKTGNPKGELAQKAALLHKQWISFYWKSYSKEAHMGLAQMYVDDERFKAYYDQHQPGLAVFLRDAIQHYTNA